MPAGAAGGQCDEFGRQLRALLVQMGGLWGTKVAVWCLSGEGTMHFCLPFACLDFSGGSPVPLSPRQNGGPGPWLWNPPVSSSYYLKAAMGEWAVPV